MRPRRGPGPPGPLGNFLAQKPWLKEGCLLRDKAPQKPQSPETGEVQMAASPQKRQDSLFEETTDHDDQVQPIPPHLAQIFGGGKEQSQKG